MEGNKYIMVKKEKDFEMKRVQVSATIPVLQATALEEVYFDGRGEYKNRNDVLRQAIHEFLDNRGKLTTEPTDNGE